MSNDTNMDGGKLLATELEMLAKFMQYDFIADEYMLDDLKYNQSYDWLMPVWEKFRELELPQYLPKLNQLKDEIAIALVTGTLTDFYNALVNAVKWYNEVAPATEAEYEKWRGK